MSPLPPRPLPPKPLHRVRLRQRGLTLLELIIVIGVVVMLLGLGVAGLGRLSSVQLRTQTNRLAAAMRFTYSRSVAHGLYMRMVLDIEADAYWVEASETPQFLSREKRKEGEKTVEEQELEDKLEDADEEEKQSMAAVVRARYTEDGVIPRVNMERGIGIDGVMTANQEDVFSSGKAYIHFFPNGFVEPAIVYTTDGNESFYTLMLNPMTGKVDRKVGKVDPPREFAQPHRVEDEGD